MSKKGLAEAGGTRDLFESERNFRLLVEGVVDYAICMLDPTGHVINWNAGAERIKGYKASEILGKHFSVFYTPRDRDAGVPARALETAREHGKFEAEGWRIRKDGTEFLSSVVIDAIYEAGELVGFAKITRDVTERHKAQEAFLESERQFRVLVSGVTDYALYMLDPEGNISSWNIGGQKIKGYTPDEIIGQHFSRFYTEADRADGRPARALSIAQTAGRYEEEGWRVRKDGSFFWASVIIDPIRDDHGKLLGFAKITRDITERRDAQIALEKIQRRLAESQKLDALGQLTGGIAHDFNNILMIVSGHLQTLKRAAGQDQKVQRAAQAIEHATQRAATLTNQLLTFSRRQQVNPEQVDVAAQIHAFREVLNSGFGHGFSLLVDIAPDTWPVTVDIGEFETAILNLVINARDAMPDGGTVCVSVKNNYSEELDGDCVAVTVTDTGVGIPDDVIGKIFDPFFTTKPVGKGTGLGLSQVHGFVHQAGGTVTALSTLGQGTKITMYLRRTSERSATSDSGRAEDISANGTTVLLVEDNPDVASASTELLEQLGYAVRWVSDAATALEEIERNGIQVVLSDIVMPGPMDGLGLAHAIKKARPGLPILLTTGYSEAAHNARTEYPILRKPYLIHELSRALADITR
ncbi:MAG TPA: PAS domain S-box protein [Pseudolabrys sp.]|jgi:PAS domain S-box-containing protein